MENNVMSLQSKLISQKTKFKNLIFALLGISVFIVLLMMSGTFCGIQHMLLVNDLKSYEKSLDPEYCELLVERIDLFNEKCEPEIEILDCG
jgi:hypothetical protein